MFLCIVLKYCFFNFKEMFIMVVVYFRVGCLWLVEYVDVQVKRCVIVFENVCQKVVFYFVVYSIVQGKVVIIFFIKYSGF